MLMNELQHRWLFQAVRDDPSLRCRMEAEVKAVGVTSRAEYEAITAQIHAEPEAGELLVLLVKRNAVAQTLQDVSDVLADLHATEAAA